MNENLQKFLEYASENEDVRQKLDELKNETDKDVIVAKVVEVAKEAGFTLSAADFDEADMSGELSEDELDEVAGGKKCFCIAGGGGKSTNITLQDGQKAENKTCACAGVGLGYISIGKETGFRCECAVLGTGSDEKVIKQTNAFCDPLF